MRFFSLVLEGSFLALLPFLGAFGGPKGSHVLLVFVKKCCFSWKGGTLVFAHPYSVLAWFSASGTSRGSKKQEKTASKLSSFFWYGKETTQTVFYNFKVLVGVISGSLLVDFWSLLVDFWKVLLLFFGSVWGTAPGPLLAPFWNHFALILWTFVV